MDSNRDPSAYQPNTLPPYRPNRLTVHVGQPFCFCVNERLGQGGFQGYTTAETSYQAHIVFCPITFVQIQCKSTIMGRCG